MQLPPYVLIEHPTELKDKTLIMATTTPYIIGQVWRFRDAKDMGDFIDRNGDNTSIIPGFRILIKYVDNLEQIKLHPSEIVGSLSGMRDFYHSVRIAPNAPRYNRYKID